jgi:hypothetical protein
VVGAGVSLQRSAANEEAAGVITAGLVADCRHRPVAEAGAVEEDLEAGVGNEGGRGNDVIAGAPGHGGTGQHWIGGADAGAQAGAGGIEVVGVVEAAVRIGDAVGGIGAHP